jgi:DNA-binding response OmpR family regulator
MQGDDMNSDKITFLVVDDDPVALETARVRLQRLGFSVTTRSESLGTSAWILSERPNFVLLDATMPALAGGDLGALLRRRRVETGIILHSRKPIAELRQIVQETGALGAVTKTFGEYLFNYEVVRLVRKYLQGRGEMSEEA